MVSIFRALFPCDDSMVCIIDDREDIWDCAPNLITVKPYRFFTGTGDINAPPGSEQTFTHLPAIPLHEDTSEVEVKDKTDGKGEDENEKGEKDSTDGGEPKNSSDGSQKSASMSEKSETNESPGKDKEVHEINHNEKGRPLDETCEGKDGNNAEMATKNEEEGKEDSNETQDNDVEGENSEKENQEASSKVSEKAKDEDAVDGNHHIEDHDDYLLYLEEILRRIHSSFYEVVAWNKQAEENGKDSTSRVAPDLRHIVPDLRRSVLKGTNLVFTGVIPTNTVHEDSQAWKIARQFGANVTKDLLTQKNNADRSKRTTHVVAARPGTEKACHALRLPSVRLVNPNWLWTCAERWEWVDERLFPVEDYHEYKIRRNDTPTSSRQGTPKGQDSKNNNKGNTSDDPEESVEHITDDNLRIVLNPFLSFSSGEMEAMDKEVEDLMRSSDEEDDKDDGNEQILGSVSSSSNSTENGDSVQKVDQQSTGEDVTDGGMVDAPKGKAINFSTITQNRHEEEGSPSKRRKLDFVENDNEGSEGEFSTDGGSSGSNSGDDEGNDMAALLEAELFS